MTVLKPIARGSAYPVADSFLGRPKLVKFRVMADRQKHGIVLVGEPTELLLEQIKADARELGGKLQRIDIEVTVEEVGVEGILLRVADRGYDEFTDGYTNYVGWRDVPLDEPTG